MTKPCDSRYVKEFRLHIVAADLNKIYNACAACGRQLVGENAYSISAYTDDWGWKMDEFTLCKSCCSNRTRATRMTIAALRENLDNVRRRVFRVKSPSIKTCWRCGCDIPRNAYHVNAHYYSGSNTKWSFRVYCSDCCRTLKDGRRLITARIIEEELHG